VNFESISRVLQTIALFCVLSVAVVTLAGASEKKPKTATPLMPGAQGAVTRHTLTLPNRIIRYTATAGTITLRDAKAQPTARMFCEGRPLRTATSRCITA